MLHDVEKIHGTTGNIQNWAQDQPNVILTIKSTFKMKREKHMF